MILVALSENGLAGFEVVQWMTGRVLWRSATLPGPGFARASSFPQPGGSGLAVGVLYSGGRPEVWLVTAIHAPRLVADNASQVWGPG